MEVEDASGARFHIHEFTCRRLFSRYTRFKLDTGEAARRLDDHTFEIIATGESLVVCP
jgi:hypothetical protein